jgi:hypothetical protein
MKMSSTVQLTDCESNPVAVQHVGGGCETLHSARCLLGILLIAMALPVMTACGDGSSVAALDDEPDSESNVFVNDRQTSGCMLISEG